MGWSIDCVYATDPILVNLVTRIFLAAPLLIPSFQFTVFFDVMVVNKKSKTACIKSQIRRMDSYYVGRLYYEQFIDSLTRMKTKGIKIAAYMCVHINACENKDTVKVPFPHARINYFSSSRKCTKRDSPKMTAQPRLIYRPNLSFPFLNVFPV